jgi:hypothetical protein
MNDGKLIFAQVYIWTLCSMNLKCHHKMGGSKSNFTLPNKYITSWEPRSTNQGNQIMSLTCYLHDGGFKKHGVATWGLYHLNVLFTL